MLSDTVMADLTALSEQLEAECKVLRPRMLSLDIPREVQADELIGYSQWIARLVRAMVSGVCLSETACREALTVGERAFERGVAIVEL